MKAGLIVGVTSPVKVLSTNEQAGSSLSEVEIKTGAQKVKIDAVSPSKEPPKDGSPKKDLLATPKAVKVLNDVLASPTTTAKVATQNPTLTPGRALKLAEGVQALDDWISDPLAKSPQTRKVRERVAGAVRQLIRTSTSSRVDSANGQQAICGARDLVWFREAHDNLLKLVHKGTKPGEDINEEFLGVFINIDHLTSATATGTGWHFVEPGDPNAAFIDAATDRVKNSDTGVYFSSFQLPHMPTKKFSTFFEGVANADELVAMLRQAEVVMQFGTDNFLLKVTTPTGKVYFAESASNLDDQKRHHTVYPLFRVIDLIGAGNSDQVEFIKAGEWTSQSTFSFSRECKKVRKDVIEAVKFFNKRTDGFCPIRYRDGDTFYVDIADYIKWKEVQKGKSFPVAKGLFIKLDLSMFTATQKGHIQTCFSNSGLV